MKRSWWGSLALVLMLFTAASSSTTSAAADLHRPEIESYADGMGIALPIAEQHLEVQDRGSDLVGELQTVLGARYAGLWFDDDTGEFVIPLIDDSGRAAVGEKMEANGLGGDYRVAAADSSWRQLLGAQEYLDDEFGKLIDVGLTQTSIDPRENAVIVYQASGAGRSMETQIEDALERRDLGVEVVTRKVGPLSAGPLACNVSARSCDRPLRGGIFIEPAGTATEPTCTAGFKAIDNATGNRFMLTAGHCYQQSADWAGWDSKEVAHYIGHGEQGTFPGGDYAKIRVNGYGKWWEEGISSWPSEVVFWGGSQHIPIEAESWSYLGQAVCHSGWTSGSSCGTVTALNKTVSYGSQGTVHNLTEVSGPSFVALPGDSGGPVWAGNTALGLVSGGPIGGGNLAYYVEITESTDALGVQVGARQGGPPSAQTSAASGVNATQSTLNGSVNPNGIPTTYRFEYGPTTSYGYSLPIPDGNAGSGSSSVTKSVLATGLLSDTTYHYRIVASNPAGTSFGGDQLFTTADMGIAHGWAIREPVNGLQWLYYANAGSGLVQWAWNGSSWNSGTIGGTVASGSTPTVTRDPATGNQWVYYVNGSGSLAQWAWNGSSWNNGVFSGSVAASTSPSAVTDPATGNQWVYYVNGSGSLAQWAWNGSSWNNGVFSGSVKAGTSPAAIRSPSPGTQWVYYVNGSGAIALWGWNGSSWESGVIGGSVATGSSPAVVWDPNTGTQWVYYVNSSGAIAEWAWNGSKWNGGVIGGTVAAGSSPAVVQDQANRTTWVYYANASGGISQKAWDGSKWNSGTLGSIGGTVKTGTSPLAIRDPNTGNQWVYYLNSSGGISQWAWNGSKWNGGTL